MVIHIQIQTDDGRTVAAISKRIESGGAIMLPEIVTDGSVQLEGFDLVPRLAAPAAGGEEG
jgi:hypothetical protein